MIPTPLPTPLTDLALSVGQAWAQKQGSRQRQKLLGQFFTPSPLALLMAQRTLNPVTQERVHLLDPAAGAGILIAAALDVLLARATSPSFIQVTLFEIDAGLVPLLKKQIVSWTAACAQVGCQLVVTLRTEDFLLAPDVRDHTLCVDVVLTNPPYFKLSATSAQARAYPAAVHGQPNIYGLFMVASAALLAPKGRWCAITPRSWLQGAYFKAVRRTLSSMVRLDVFHAFTSRTDPFSSDAVLQETVITWGVRTSKTRRGPTPRSIGLSTSTGAATCLEAPVQRLARLDCIGKAPDFLLTLRTHPDRISSVFSHTLASLGLTVATGPVVAFRAQGLLSQHASTQAGTPTIPLLWLPHCLPMEIRWPLPFHKGQYLHCAAPLQTPLALRFTPLVLLRRFSPKEAPRRIVAAPLPASLDTSGFLGIENHLNVLTRPGAPLSVHEVTGLALYLNSRAVDDYMQGIAGSTQINARDLRGLPLPSLAQMASLGASWYPGATLDDCDRLVNDLIMRQGGTPPV